MTIMHKDIREQHLRYLVNDIFEYLEENEGFYFDIFDEFNILALSGKALTSKNMTLAHAVQIKMVIQEMKKSWIKTPNQLLKFIKENYFIYLITGDEDKTINKNGLRQKMSAIWNNNGKGWKSRYDEVGIKLVMNPDP